MRTIACWLLLGAMGAAVSPAVVADSKTDPKAVWTRTFVTLHGRMAASEDSPLEATLTFSEPVRLPKMTLPAGTYLFRMMTPSRLRISSADGRKTLATIATTTITRTKDLQQPLVRFERHASDRPPRLIAIFPENASDGYQLVAPDARQQDQGPVATTGIR